MFFSEAFYSISIEYKFCFFALIVFFYTNVSLIKLFNLISATEHPNERWSKSCSFSTWKKIIAVYYALFLGVALGKKVRKSPKLNKYPVLPCEAFFNFLILNPSQVNSVYLIGLTHRSSIVLCHPRSFFSFLCLFTCLSFFPIFYNNQKTEIDQQFLTKSTLKKLKLTLSLTRLVDYRVLVLLRFYLLQSYYFALKKLSLTHSLTRPLMLTTVSTCKAMFFSSFCPLSQFFSFLFLPSLSY